MVHTATNHARKWAVFSPEMQPWEQFAASCAEVYVGQPFYPDHERRGMSDAEIADAEAWLADRITMLVCDAEDQAPTVDWILERARAAVLRDGATDFLVDPWNEIDHSRPDGVTETEYTGRSLQRFKAFALRHGCNVWVICHPAKPLLKNGEKAAVPTAYSISGSAHWFNKTDLGLTVHSPKENVAEVHVWKARFRRHGRHPSSATLDYDPITGRYATPAEPALTAAAVKMWNDS
jgi:twinkle protein